MTSSKNLIRLIRACAGLFCVAAFVLAADVLLRSAVTGRWPIRSDDMYYYFLLVRHSVQDGVVSTDGLRPTNGFHPLFFLVLRYAYAFVPEASLDRFALLLLGAFHLATSLLLGLTVRRLCGRTLALVAAGLYVANPYVLQILFRGVETSISCFFIALAIWLYVCKDQDEAAPRGRTPRHLALLAAVFLAVASRTDSVFLAVALTFGGALALVGGPADVIPFLRNAVRSPFRNELVQPSILFAALLPVIGFALWSKPATGEWLQTSGRALSFWQSVGWRGDIETELAKLGLPQGALVGVVYGLSMVVQTVLNFAKAGVWFLLGTPSALLLGVIAAGARRAARKEKLSGGTSTDVYTAEHKRLVRTLLGWQVLLWLFYGVVFRHCHDWYWHSSIYGAALLFAVFLLPLRQRFLLSLENPAGAGRWKFPIPMPVAAVAVLFLALAITHRGLRRLQPAPVTAVPKSILAGLPAGKSVGCFDSGSVGWFHKDLHIVNLDGLVNNASYRALRKREIGRYMLDQKLDYLLTDEKVIERFKPFGLEHFLNEAVVVKHSGGYILYRRNTGGAGERELAFRRPVAFARQKEA